MALSEEDCVAFVGASVFRLDADIVLSSSIMDEMVNESDVGMVVFTSWMSIIFSLPSLISFST